MIGILGGHQHASELVLHTHCDIRAPTHFCCVHICSVVLPAVNDVQHTVHSNLREAGAARVRGRRRGANRHFGPLALRFPHLDTQRFARLYNSLQKLSVLIGVTARTNPFGGVHSDML